MSDRIKRLANESCRNDDREGPEVDLKLACEMVEGLEKELEVANLQLMDIQSQGAYEKGHEHGVNAAMRGVAAVRVKFDELKAEYAEFAAKVDAQTLAQEARETTLERQLAKARERIDVLRREVCDYEDTDCVTTIHRLQKELESERQMHDLTRRALIHVRGARYPLDGPQLGPPSREALDLAIKALERAVKLFSDHYDYCGYRPYDDTCDCGADDARDEMEAALVALKA